MAAIARAPAGGGQGHSDAPRRTILTAGRSVFPRSCSDLSVVNTELEKTGRVCHSRFLKVRNENGRGSQRGQPSGNAVQTGSRHVAKSAPGSASHTRLSSALRKVAQLESKIMNRRKQMELQSIDLGQTPLGEESLSSASSHEHSARGKKYLKNYATTGGNMTLGNACSKEEESIQRPKKNVTVKQQLGLDSDEEEMRELMENSLEFPSENEYRRVVVTDSKWGGKSKTPVSSGMPPPSHKEISPTEVSKASFFHSKDSEKNVSVRGNSPAPSPASRNLSVLHNMRSQSPSSSVKDNTVKTILPRTGNTKQSQISLGSDRSEIKSLDELFSKAADGEDSTSSRSNDFRLNILSLDDLAPNSTSEAAELKQKGTDLQMTQESNRNPKKDTFLVEKDQTSLKMASVVTGVNDASKGDIDKTDAEISEQLSGVSADFPRHKQDYLDHDERTVNSEYSEDFERSLSTTDRKSVSKMSEEHSESRTYSGKHPSSASSPSRTREQHKRVQRVTVKETAVQTVDPLFTYHWSKTNTSAVLDPPVGHSYVDPIPVASHTISMDAVEALTAYSPSVLVLNAMLKQHLLLTQQFVENIHHLHSSLVESLESEKFHYHTLEEAKEYIKKHKSPPLTLEQAREEIWKAQEEKLL
uniref:Chromosome 19 open reading frame 44 n=1 Tax=Otus sunia TaxID=257818 RepID=A0A8C8AW98_9STRI